MVTLSTFLALLAFIAAGDAYREAKDEEFPFRVSIRTPSRRHLCGGVIIAPNWVLTASLCLQSHSSVIVTYGSADSSSPEGIIDSLKIEHQQTLSALKRKELALIQLKESIRFSKTTQQASLPLSGIQLSNTTKLTVWKIEPLEDTMPKLYVSDTYYVIPKDCMTTSGFPVNLDDDEFCGISGKNENEPVNLSAVVSKGGTVLGILTNKHLNSNDPAIYVKIWRNEKWIRDILQWDANYVHWVNSAPRYVISWTLFGISIIFLCLF